MKLGILLCLILLSLSRAQAVQFLDQNPSTDSLLPTTCQLATGCRINVSTDIFQNQPETLKKVQQKYDVSPDKGLDQGLRQRQLLQQEYQRKIASSDRVSKIKIPVRRHQNGETSHSFANSRRLYSTNNQYDSIDQGNTYQATDQNYIYSLRAPTIKIHKIQGLTLTQIYSQTFSYTFYPQQIHAGGGYFALIFQAYRPSNVIIRVYKNTGASASLVRQYKKQGTYVGSREYNSNIILVSQQEMKSPALDYTWTVSGVGQVDESVYDGISANKTANNVGYAVRSLARIPMSQLSNYRFASYLFCDYSWDIMLSPPLNLYIAGNHYNSSGYAVAIQKLQLNDATDQNWGVSQWIILPGIILNSYQLHQYNLYLRVVTNYANGQLGTVGQVSVFKVPLASFDPFQGSAYHNLGIAGMSFYASRWRKDIVDLIFTEKVIKSFSTSLGITVGTTSTKQRIFYLFPYGSYVVGFGENQNANNVAIVAFQVRSYKLVYKQSLTLDSTYSYSSYGWYGTQFLQFDYKNKRITFPVFSSESQPYKSGYYQVYADPANGCLSTLPISSPCSTTQDVIAPVSGKAFKHWDDSEGYDWNTGSSQEIKRSSTIVSGGQNILITGSQCQLQARILKGASSAPIMNPSNQSSPEFTYVDLCV